MPSRYPLCKRLSKGGVRGFLLTLWSGGEIFFSSKHINFILIWCTTQLNRPQTINSRFPRTPLASCNSPPSLPLSRWRAFWLVVVWFSFVGGNLRPQRIFVVVFILRRFAAPSEETTLPLHVLPRLPLLFNAPPTIDANFWLVVVSPHQTAAI